MIDIQTMLAFFVFICSMACIPAPDNMLIAFQSGLQGRIAGLSIVLGVCVGLVAHSVAVILGLSALLQSSDRAFFILQCFGVLYLLYLAINAFWFEPKRLSHQQRQITPLKALFTRGLLLTLFNPIVGISMLLIFPNFMDQTASNPGMQLIQLSILMIIAVFIVFNGYALLAAGAGNKWLQSVRAQRYLCYVAGSVIVVFAVFLARTTSSL